MIEATWNDYYMRLDAKEKVIFLRGGVAILEDAMQHMRHIEVRRQLEWLQRSYHDELAQLEAKL